MRGHVRKAPVQSGIRYVSGISWPRSGHHLLVDVLQSYFGEEFNYCEFYKPVDCCKKSPCARAPKIKFSKNHDFESKAEFRKGTPYLIQYRSFVPSIISAFEMYVQSGQPDTPDSFQVFARYQTARYNAFLERWTFGPSAPKESLLISYEMLTSESKIKVLTDIIAFFAPDHAIDDARLLKITMSVQKLLVEAKKTTTHLDFGIRATRVVEEFRFFDGDFFNELRSLTCESELLANLIVHQALRSDNYSSKRDLLLPGAARLAGFNPRRTHTNP